MSPASHVALLSLLLALATACTPDEASTPPPPAPEGRQSRELSSSEPYLVQDLSPGTQDSNPFALTPVGDTLFFTLPSADDTPMLWKTSGTGATPVSAPGVPPGTLRARLLTPFGDRLAFSYGGAWLSDGTEAGTVSLPAAGASAFRVRGGSLFFTSGTTRLYRSDGTAAGTVLLKQTGPENGSSWMGDELVDANGTLYFAGTTAATGTELWKSDGTEAGTVLVRDIIPGFGSGTLEELTPVNGRLFFVAFGTAPDPSLGELWTSNGTSAGTRSLGMYAAHLVGVGGTLFFTSGPNLATSNGTSSGTRIVKQLSPGPGISFREPTAMGDTLLFVTDDEVTGGELWKSDGTEAGTVVVKDIHPGPGSSRPQSLTLVDGVLYFLAAADGSDFEVWRSDGTEAGTFALSTRLDARSLSLKPFEAAPRMARVQGTLYFTARDAAHGQELWALPLSALTCPPPLVVEATSAAGTEVPYPVPTVAADATGTPGFTYEPPASHPLPLGTTQVRVSAPSLPPYGPSSCGFTVTVRDTTPPTVTCPAAQDTESTLAGAAVAFPAATATDAVTSAPTLHYSHASGSTFPRGATEVTVTARDEAGNAATCTFTVTVREAEARPPDAPDAPGAGVPSGAGCGVTPPGALALGFLFLLAPLTRGRRRRETRRRSR